MSIPQPVPLWGRVSLALGLFAAPLLPQGVRSLGQGQTSDVAPLPLTAPPGNERPSLSTDLAPDRTAYVGEDLRFHVTVDDPDGDAVSLRLLNPPAEVLFQPRTNAPSPLTAEVRYLIGPWSAGHRSLVFEAWDDDQPSERVRFTVELRILGDGNQGAMNHGDVTGDGVIDVVSAATQADVGGTSDVGALYVWAGGSPSATPTATLTVPGASAGDRLGEAGSGQGIQLVDVTGDGILDVVAVATGADVGGLADAGALYVWNGGAGLSGPKSPDATLTVPGAVAGDQLGFVGSGQGVQCVHVDGDGVLDLVVGASLADAGGVVDSGAVYLWRGGVGLSGSVAPEATLSVAGASAQDRLGDVATGQGIGIIEVTGDGQPDLVVGTSVADRAATDSGAVYVWDGSALSGSVSPSATLEVPAAVTGDRLGDVFSGQGLQFQDVTGDGVNDVVVGAYLADVGGVADTGALYVWRGGASLVGTLGPFASLTVPGALASDQLCDTGSGSGIVIADVSGDGTRDLVVGAYLVNALNQGAVYVWNGGASLTGSVSPSATLRIVGGERNDKLTYVGSGQGLLVAEVTGDGVLDILAGSPEGNLGAFDDNGAVYVWTGGAGLIGNLTPNGTLSVPGALAGDRLGNVGSDSTSQGIQLADVTGDGVLDLVAGAIRADVGGVINVGAIYVWSGSTGFLGNPAPLASLTVPGAQDSDFLGYMLHGQGIQLADVTGDLVLDIVAGAYRADDGPRQDTGALYVWEGGGGLSGALSPDATLTVPAAVAFDRLGHGASGHGIFLADLTGDDVLDVLAGTPGANEGGVIDAGAVYAWTGGAALSGPLAPSFTLAVPGALPNDRLGNVGVGQAVQLSDVTGDGQLDLVAGAFLTNVGGVVDSGAIQLWTGPTSTSVAPTATLSVPGAAASDSLGR